MIVIALKKHFLKIDSFLKRQEHIQATWKQETGGKASQQINLKSHNTFGHFRKTILDR